MDIRKLQRAIVDGLEDVKAQNIVVFNTEALSPLFERVIIASGTSNRQTKALASSVRETVKSRGLPVMATEGEDNGEWIIVDCGAAVAHIMQPGIREYYHLEELWGGKPAKMKATEVRGLPKAESAAMAKKSGARPAAEKAPARKSAPRKSAPQAAAAKKAPARKGAAKATPAHKAVGKAAGKAPAKRAARPAGKPVARKPATPRKAPRR